MTRRSSTQTEHQLIYVFMRRKAFKKLKEVEAEEEFIIDEDEKPGTNKPPRDEKGETAKSPKFLHLPFLNMWIKEEKGKESK